MKQESSKAESPPTKAPGPRLCTKKKNAIDSKPLDMKEIPIDAETSFETREGRSLMELPVQAQLNQ
jgi:hypothetical protein